ncbi:MAG: hypothetical protein HN348_31000, partial [Proteobacteria bacterium]|nr:hypothetical protein [Pseudomonadota bacterium]
QYGIVSAAEDYQIDVSVVRQVGLEDNCWFRVFSGKTIDGILGQFPGLQVLRWSLCDQLEENTEEFGFQWWARFRPLQRKSTGQQRG